MEDHLRVADTRFRDIGEQRAEVARQVVAQVVVGRAPLAPHGRRPAAPDPHQPPGQARVAEAQILHGELTAIGEQLLDDLPERAADGTLVGNVLIDLGRAHPVEAHPPDRDGVEARADQLGRRRPLGRIDPAGQQQRLQREVDPPELEPLGEGQVRSPPPDADI